MNVSVAAFWVIDGTGTGVVSAKVTRVVFAGDSVPCLACICIVAIVELVVVGAFIVVTAGIVCGFVMIFAVCVGGTRSHKLLKRLDSFGAKHLLPRGIEIDGVRRPLVVQQLRHVDRVNVCALNLRASPVEFKNQ